MKRFAYAIAGCVAGLIIGLGVASCAVLAHADDVEPSISHRKILDTTCFYSKNFAGEINTLSCVKD